LSPMNKQKSPKVIVIAGPTAAGKTGAAIKLARILDGEIISADSVQVYKYLDIGSAKPTAKEQSKAVHHLIDVVAPDQYFSGGKYADLGRKVILDIEERQKKVIVCGGTGLYIRALLSGLFKGPSADLKLRKHLREQESKTPGSLHEYLLKIDPEKAEKIHPNDQLRLIRAIEVFELTGIPLSVHHKQHQKQPSFREYEIYVLDPPAEILKERIVKRVEQMLDQGFVEEVEDLLARGYSPKLRSLQTKGYKEVVSFLQGDLNKKELKAAIIKSHLRYVKQQRTWFRKKPNHLSRPEDLPVEEIRSFFSD
jgi:tRNA dimethylallyltransferase